MVSPTSSGSASGLPARLGCAHPRQERSLRLRLLPGTATSPSAQRSLQPSCPPPEPASWTTQPTDQPVPPPLVLPATDGRRDPDGGCGQPLGQRLAQLRASSGERVRSGRRPVPGRSRENIAEQRALERPGSGRRACCEATTSATARAEIPRSASTQCIRGRGTLSGACLDGGR
jgi:hypothetical protein